MSPFAVVLLAVLCTSEAVHLFNRPYFSGEETGYQPKDRIDHEVDDPVSDTKVNRCTATMCCPPQLTCGPYYTCIERGEWKTNMERC